MNILVVLPVNAQQKEKLEHAGAGHSFFYASPDLVTPSLLSGMDVLIGNLPVSLVKQAKNLRWIQLNNAGTEGFLEEEVVGRDTLLTNATGAYGSAISEHMIAMLFMLQKQLHTYYLQQQKGEWKKAEPMQLTEGATVLVIGLGDIGSTFARKMTALGARVIGIRRHLRELPDYVEEQYTLDALEDVLPRADIVALSLPAYEETRHVIDERALSLMKKTAVLINVGRGSAVDTDALTDALRNEEIGGAALDVTEEEPLPSSHSLWYMHHTVITPHASGGFALPATLDKIIDIAADNLARYCKNEPLRNIVDRMTGYAKN